MNIKRAIGISVAAYIVTFLLTIIISIVIGFDFTEATDPSDVPQMFLLFGSAAAVVIMILSTFWYFKKEGLVPSAGHGFGFGLTAIVIAFILDFLSVVPLLFTDENALAFLGSYYATPAFIITVVLIILVTTGVGYYLGTKTPSQDSLQQ